MSDLTTKERQWHSAHAPKCRCGNQASLGHDTCGACRASDEATAERVALLRRVYSAATLEELHSVVIELAERVLHG